MRTIQAIILVLLVAASSGAEIVLKQSKQNTVQNPSINDMELVRNSNSTPHRSFTLEHMRFSTTLMLIINGYIKNSGSRIMHAPRILFEGKSESGKTMCKRQMIFDNIYPGEKKELVNFSVYCPEGKPGTVEYTLTER